MIEFCISLYVIICYIVIRIIYELKHELLRQSCLRDNVNKLFARKHINLIIILMGIFWPITLLWTIIVSRRRTF